MDDAINGRSGAALPDAPRGIYPARVDEKGRLKLPVNFGEYLAGQPLFVTSLDMRIARIYPISVWRENEKLLANGGDDDPDMAEDVAFIANHYGADAEVDGQGRVLLPTDLRRELNMESQPVWLDFFQGGINVYNKAVYEERHARAREHLADKLKTWKKKGLK